MSRSHKQNNSSLTKAAGLSGAGLAGLGLLGFCAACGIVPILGVAGAAGIAGVLGASAGVVALILLIGGAVAFVRARRRGAISLIPAMFAAPVCCGAPLLSFLGTGAIVPLARITPLLLIATCLLLATGTWRLRRQRKRLLPATPLGRTDF